MTMRTNQVRLKSFSEIQYFGKEKEAKALFEQEAQRKFELAELERQRIFELTKPERLAQEQAEKETASQNYIDGISKNVSEIYFSLFTHDFSRKSKEKALKESQDIYTTFLENEDTMFPVKEYDEKITRTMQERRWAYWLLPVGDIICACFAIVPMMQNKAVNMNFPSLAGAGFGVLLGVIATLLGRLGRSSDDDDSKWKNLSYLSIFFIPIFYGLYYFVFSERTGGDIVFVSGFSILSLYIQMRIIKDYPKHVEARAYFKEKEKNDVLLQSRDAQNDLLSNDIINNTKELERHTDEFIKKIHQFGIDLRDLEIARLRHIDAFKNMPRILMYDDFHLMYDEIFKTSVSLKSPSTWGLSHSLAPSASISTW